MYIWKYHQVNSKTQIERAQLVKLEMSTQNLREKVLHSLADETLVDLETTFQDAHIPKVLDQLDRELVGLKSVKTRVKEIATLLLVDRAHQTLGLTSVDSSLHMCFAGNPGTDAIAVAARMAEILHHLGYLRQANARSVRNDLEQARLRQANRLLARGGKSVTKKDLMTIKAEDIEREPVFKESIPDCVVA